MEIWALILEVISSFHVKVFETGINKSWQGGGKSYRLNPGWLNILLDFEG